MQDTITVGATWLSPGEMGETTVGSVLCSQWLCALKILGNLPCLIKEGSQGTEKVNNPPQGHKGQRDRFEFFLRLPTPLV